MSSAMLPDPLEILTIAAWLQDIRDSLNDSAALFKRGRKVYKVCKQEVKDLMHIQVFSDVLNYP